jgi:hypothetical protein
MAISSNQSPLNRLMEVKEALGQSTITAQGPIAQLVRAEDS